MGAPLFSSDYGQIAHGCWFSLRSLTDFLKKRKHRVILNDGCSFSANINADGPLDPLCQIEFYS